MPARALPERPEFTTESEREVWDRLVKGLRPEDVVLSNVRLTDERQDYEIDLLALLPGAGFVRHRTILSDVPVGGFARRISSFGPHRPHGAARGLALCGYRATCASSPAGQGLIVVIAGTGHLSEPGHLPW